MKFATAKIYLHILSSLDFFCLLLVASSDHSDYDCFVCCILTHGKSDDVLYAKDDTFLIEDITRPFGADKCPSLAGKPKLFFVQVNVKRILPIFAS